MGYKTLVETRKETAGGTGGWFLIGYVGKEEQRFKATLEKLKITYFLDDRNDEGSTDGATLVSPHLGCLMVLSRQATLSTVDGEASQLDPRYIVSLASASGAAGSRSYSFPGRGVQIHQNGEDLDEQDGRVYIWFKHTDITADDDLVWRFFYEAEGRWLDVQGV